MKKINGWNVGAFFGDQAFYKGDWLMRAGAGGSEVARLSWLLAARKPSYACSSCVAAEGQKRFSLVWGRPGAAPLGTHLCRWRPQSPMSARATV